MATWRELAKQEELANQKFAEKLGKLLNENGNSQNSNINKLFNPQMLVSPSNYNTRMGLPGLVPINQNISSKNSSTINYNSTDPQSFLVNEKEELNEQSKAEMSLLTKYCRQRLNEINESNFNMKNIDIYNYENTLGYNEDRDQSTPPLSFEDFCLDPQILEAIYGCGFHRPSRIQELTLPIMKEGHNVIAQSQSGTGKTAAFVIAMLSAIELNRNVPQALCLSPTFELSLQIFEVIEQLSKFMIPALRIGRAFKKSSQFSSSISSSSLTDPYPIDECQIIIGTPGTVHNLLKKRELPSNQIKVFVLDEADVMLDLQGMSSVSVHINKFLSPNCQRLLFSATYDSKVIDFAKSILPNAKIFSLEKPKLVLTNISQFCIVCNNFDEKLHVLIAIYGGLAIGQCIVFCDTKIQAASLVKFLQSNGFPAALLSSELTIEDRARVIQDFRDGKERLIVATNVLARGIDIEQVNLVLNFNLPHIPGNFKMADVDTYIHRIGRCGRFGKKGLAINMIEPNQLELLHQIEADYKIKIPILEREKILTAQGDEIQELLK